MSYSNTFTGGAVAPAIPSFEALTIAVTTSLVWPLENTAGAPYAASWINVTATETCMQLRMPPGNTGSTGPASIIANVGANSFTVTDQAGNQITPIAAGQVWIIVLTANATANGTWSATQLGSTVSNATASGLAGPGLVANGTLLQLSWATTTLSASASITSSADGSVLLYTGSGAATWSLGTIGSGVTAGTIFAFANQSSNLSNLTFTSAGGNLINGVTSLVVPANGGGFLIAGASSWTAITYGAVFPSLSVANGAMTVDTSGNLVANSLTSVTTLSVAAGSLTISNTGNVSTTGTISANGIGTFGNIQTTGTVLASGNIVGGNGYFANISGSGTINVGGSANFGSLNSTGKITAAQGFSTFGTLNATEVDATTNMSAGGTLNVTGNITTGATLNAPYVNASTISPGGLLGVSSSATASAGYVGEVVTGNFSNITLQASGVINSLVNITLTAGDWDVKGVASFAISGTAGYINIAVSTNGSFPGYNNGLSQFYMPNPTSSGVVGTLIPCQVVLSASQSVTFLYQAVYSSGSIVAQGFFQARRMR